MNSKDRIREHRSRYRENVGLGLFRGRGLLSGLIWTVFSFIRGPESKKKQKKKDPASFEKLD